MAEKNFSDLHCHPAMRPLNLATGSLWHTHRGKRDRGVIIKQIKGKRAALYDQAGNPKMLNGDVKLVFASLYPLEQGFMVNNNLILGSVNAVARAGVAISFILNAFRPVHLRDYLLSLFIKFTPERIDELKKQEYWDGFLEEYRAFCAEHNRIKQIDNDTRNEISALRKKRPDDIPARVHDNGNFRIADQSWDLRLPADDRVLTVLTMEGMAIVTQTKRNFLLPRHGTEDLPETVIFERIKYIKERIPLFFITFSHHFSSGLCGHAQSFPGVAETFGILDQSHMRNKNFNDVGYRVLQYLLSVKQSGSSWVDDTTAGRRILIDVKHMSLRGRLTLYQLTSLYNRDKPPGQKIPVIASHVGYSHRSIAELLHAIHHGTETSENQIGSTVRHGRTVYFNTWSINLAHEEVRWIVESGGLIGVCLEQNILGIGFGKKVRKKKKQENPTLFAQMILDQMLMMGVAAGTERFWDCIMIGSDFDGVIDPVDKYSSALFFHGLRNDLLYELNQLRPVALQEAHCHYNSATFDILLNKIFIENAHDFLRTHFKPGAMPLIPSSAFFSPTIT